ncbi:flagellar protein export ATPase FliI [Pseudidiomarina insulisalsae]|uniref:Flagellum-specific ATP synthase n=1 Tax=Pseudidiomarina insulisalsae TaxID=575789 RepID=A0A432YDL2_9GAMM|nr:flagellar protein export ATPase FliI [Pseudidiomarina insulisalsae]RUO59054.1 flagellar protein export ATPase FliI [Pseudidiomarina insulisalsae]
MAHTEYTERWRTSVRQVQQRLAQLPQWQRVGRLTRATGVVLEAAGLNLPVGSACMIEADQQSVAAEVVGFARDVTFLMPLEHAPHLTPGARIRPLHGKQSQRRYPLGAQLSGRVLDGLGRPLDGKDLRQHQHFGELSHKTINPMQRAPIATPIDVGVRAINSLLTVGRGQRIGLFAGSGVGKSVLLGMMARFTDADRIVVALIGERGREVQEFIETSLGEAGRKRSVIVAAPADTSPLERLQGAAYATRLAEDFRDKGEHVLLIMDSLTRYAMAQREIALAVGEPPVTKGYPPSVFAKLPAIVERAGTGKPGGGTITAFYTVLTEGDDQQDPIADAARAILDGHIVLSRRLAESAHYPAIDIEASISRVMPAIVSQQQLSASQRLKRLFATYQRNHDLISVGAYQSGHDALLDQAVQSYPRIAAFLQQQMDEQATFEAAIKSLVSLTGGHNE